MPTEWPVAVSSQQSTQQAPRQAPSQQLASRPHADFVSGPPSTEVVTAALAAAGDAEAEAALAGQAVLDAQSVVATAARTVAAVAARARTAAGAASLAAADAAARAAASASAVIQAETDARSAASARAAARAAERDAAAVAQVASDDAAAGELTELSALVARAVAASQAEQTSSAAVAATVGHAVEAAALAAARAAASAAVAVEAEIAAAALSAASVHASGARAVAAAIDAKAAVLSHAAIAAAEARRTEERLTHDVLHDDLTGLANRRLLVDRLTQALARSARSGTCVGVLFLDLDDFKGINDTYGHLVGDEVLVWTARKLQRCLRETDTAARVGGDEFVVVCEELADPADGALVADRLQAALRDGLPVGDEVVSVRVSIGIAVSSAGSAPLELLQEADSSMYSAKGSANRRFQVGPPHRG